MSVKQLDEGLWVINTPEVSQSKCCFVSREAAVLATSLPEANRTALQQKVGSGLITYRDVFRAVASRAQQIAAMQRAGSTAVILSSWPQSPQ